MQREQVLKFIEEKKKYIAKDYKIHFIFEVFYNTENDELYKGNWFKLERKLDEPVRSITPYKMKNFVAKICRNGAKYHQIGMLKNNSF